MDTQSATSAGQQATPHARMSVRQLNLYYGDFHALKDINLDIRANSITALIGPSGCGKSTFLRCLNRMNDLIEGCLLYTSDAADE